MVNASHKINKVAKAAVAAYKENGTPPGDTIYKEFQKLSNYNFNHIKRATEKANVDITQDVILKTAEDKGQNFPLADPKKIAAALNIRIEKESPKIQTKTASDLAADFPIGMHEDNNFGSTSAFFEAVSQNPKTAYEHKAYVTQPMIDEARKTAGRELLGAMIRLEESHNKLEGAIKHAVARQKDITDIAMIINRDYGTKVAALFMKAAAGTVGKQILSKTASKLIPEGYMPDYIKTALDSFVVARGDLETIIRKVQGEE